MLKFRFDRRIRQTVLATRISKFPSVVDVSEECYCFDVLFESPIPLKKDVSTVLMLKSLVPILGMVPKATRLNFVLVLNVP